MKASSTVTLIKILALLCLSVLCVSKEFDFFYFVQQWPGSYRDTKQGCYPATGKPAADFGIHGLWPTCKNRTSPQNCFTNPFNLDKIADLNSSMHENWPTFRCGGKDVDFWKHEWEKHGTCSESVFDDQHGYFQAALGLHKQVNLLEALRNAEIIPGGRSYSLSNITSAIQKKVGFTPWIECNTHRSGNSQLYQIYWCVDNTTGKNLTTCPPVFRRRKCGSQIEFPSF